MKAALEELGLGQRWVCPQLPPSPAQAIALCNKLIEEAQLSDPATELIIIGSSLGGYYAHVLAEQWGCKAVLLNPAVQAPRDLATQVDAELYYYHSDEPFEFNADYVDELAQMQPTQATELSRYYLLAASGDEVLDHQEMLTTFAGSHGVLIFGSDHGISDFPLYLPAVLHFMAPSQSHPQSF